MFKENSCQFKIPYQTNLSTIKGEIKMLTKLKQWVCKRPVITYPKSSSSQRRVIPNINTEMQEEINNTGKCKHVGKYFLNVL